MATVKEVIEGLQILEKYGAGEMSADHEVIYAGPDLSATISPEDLKRLDELGWFESEEFDCWSMFV